MFYETQWTTFIIQVRKKGMPRKKKWLVFSKNFFKKKKARRKQLAKIYKRLFFGGIIPDPLKQYVNT